MCSVQVSLNRQFLSCVLLNLFSGPIVAKLLSICLPTCMTTREIPWPEAAMQAGVVLPVEHSFFNYGDIHARTLLRKANQNLPFICEKLPFRLFIYSNPTKTHNENGKFEPCYKSVYFENGTTSHPSFSSCKRQKRFQTHTICIRHMIFTLSCVNYALCSQDYWCCRFHLIRFYHTKQISVNTAILWIE